MNVLFMFKQPVNEGFAHLFHQLKETNSNRFCSCCTSAKFIHIFTRSDKG